MTTAERMHVQWIREQDAIAAQEQADVAYARGRHHGAVAAHAVAVCAAAAKARRDLAVAQRNRALVAAAAAHA